MIDSHRRLAPRATSGPAWSWVQRGLAALLLFACLPLLGVLWLCVRRDSAGPFLFWQERPGLHGKPIRVCKIRTMTVGSERERCNGLGVKRDHPNVTRPGRWLRALKLDELPQLWNVVRGDMEFVGPRPIADALVELLVVEVPGFEDRFRAKPGLTSLGQITIVENRVGSELVGDWRRRFEAEMHHLANRSAAYDVIIILMTLAYLLRRLAREFAARLASLRGQEEETSMPRLLTLR